MWQVLWWAVWRTCVSQCLGRLGLLGGHLSQWMLPWSGSLLINFYKLFGHIGSLLLCRLSLVVVSGDCGAQAPHGSGFSFRRVSALGTWASVVVVHSWVSLQHMESSWTSARTSVPHIGRQILNHWLTREVPLQWVLCGFLEGAQRDWTIATQGWPPFICPLLVFLLAWSPLPKLPGLTPWISCLQPILVADSTCRGF